MSELHSKLAAKVHASEGALKAEEAQVDLFEEAKKTNPEEKEDEVIDSAEPVCPEGTYLGVFLHQIVRKDGTYFRPDEFGCFHPETKEEKDLCEYYVSVGRCAK